MPDHEPPEGPPQAPPGRNLPIAVVTALGLAGLILGTLFSSRTAWFLTVAAAVLGAQAELYRTLRASGHRPAGVLGLAGGALLLLGAFQRGPSALAFGITMTLVASFLWYLADREREHLADGIALTMLGLVWVPFLGAHVVLMRDLPDGPILSISYLGLVAFYDVGAFAFGSLFGRHPLAPSVSPKKTWEGAAGATFVVFVLALAVGPFLGPFTAGGAALLAAVVALVAPLGDLAESLVKRDLGVKDMGSLLPGHGGMLDRIDALLMVAPAAYWLYRAVVL